MYIIATIGLACIFAAYNIIELNEISRALRYRDAVGSLKTASAQSIIMYHELSLTGQIAWPLTSDITSHIPRVVDSASKSYNRIIYGDDSHFPPLLSLDNLFPNEVNILQSSCLASSSNFCQERQFNSSFGYTRDVVSRGVIHLHDRFQWTVQSLLAATNANSSVTPSASKISFLNQILEPELLDGWSTLEDKCETLLSDYSILLNVLFAVEAIILVFGQLILVRLIFYLKVGSI